MLQEWDYSVAGWCAAGVGLQCGGVVCCRSRITVWRGGMLQEWDYSVAGWCAAEVGFAAVAAVSLTVGPCPGGRGISGGGKIYTFLFKTGRICLVENPTVVC
jgi:hypothetical protein